VNAQGNTPINYIWTTNGTVVTGLNSNRLTLSTPCGTTLVQVSFSNVLSGGVLVNSSAVQLVGDANPINLSFNTNGIGWQTNGSVPKITNSVLVLTDGGGGEASSAFYTTPNMWVAHGMHRSSITLVAVQLMEAPSSSRPLTRR